MKRFTALLFLLIFASSGTTAEFPQRVQLVLRQKASCRDTKRLVRRNHLYVHCNSNDHFAREFEADYLGSEPLDEVLSAVASYTKVEAAVPSSKQAFLRTKTKRQ